tara:strand:- start:332 stop:1033 length:702 start_codon:yes stop_codon:yes gene_type:complete
MNEENCYIELEELLPLASTQGQGIISAVEVNPEAPVAGCPGWNNADLLGHINKVWHFMAAQLEAGNPLEPTPQNKLEYPPSSALEKLIDLLETIDFSSPTWNWTANKQAGFFVRRLAHENTIHRWDAEAAIGLTCPIDKLVAMDGIEELLYLIPFRAGSDFSRGSIHLHQTDGTGEWLLSFSNKELQVERKHSKGDAAVRGTAENLLLYLWNRDRKELECFGDTETIDAWGKE